MARTGFALGNPHGIEKGPLLIPANTEISAIDVAEQAGFGVIDVRLHFRSNDGSSIPGSPISGWLTGNFGNAGFIGTVLIPANERFAGFIVIEQFGFGVVNLRIKKVSRSTLSPVEASVLALPNQNQNRSADLDLPTGTIAEGIVGREQAGHGIVDLAIDFN